MLPFLSLSLSGFQESLGFPQRIPFNGLPLHLSLTQTLPPSPLPCFPPPSHFFLPSLPHFIPPSLAHFFSYSFTGSLFHSLHMLLTHLFPYFLLPYLLPSSFHLSFSLSARNSFIPSLRTLLLYTRNIQTYKQTKKQMMAS